MSSTSPHPGGPLNGRWGWGARATLFVGLLATSGCGAPVEAEEPVGPRVIAEGVVAQVGGDAPVEVSAERVTLGDDGPLVAEGVEAQADDGVPMNISAVRTEWDLRSGVATFSEDVVASRGVFRLACDTLVVRHGPDGRMQSAEASGAVVVSRPPYTARSQQASLDLNSGQLVLLGEPRVDDGNNELTGQRVELFLDDERMVCEACVLRIPDPTRPLPKAP